MFSKRTWISSSNSFLPFFLIHFKLNPESLTSSNFPRSSVPSFKVIYNDRPTFFLKMPFCYSKDNLLREKRLQECMHLRIKTLGLNLFPDTCSTYFWAWLDVTPSVLASTRDANKLLTPFVWNDQTSTTKWFRRKVFLDLVLQSIFLAQGHSRYNERRAHWSPPETFE